MGRPAQKVDLILANGKSHHLTKAEIERRKESEVRLGKCELDDLKPPTFIENDMVAFSYWKQYLKEYKDAAQKGIEVLSSSDVGTLALYCKTYSEYESLLKRKQIIDNDNNVSIDDYLKVETAINKKMDMLIKMQDRLFLNPLAKVKNVPKKEKEKPKNLMEDEFDV